MTTIFLVIAQFVYPFDCGSNLKQQQQNLLLQRHYEDTTLWFIVFLLCFQQQANYCTTFIIIFIASIVNKWHTILSILFIVLMTDRRQSSSLKNLQRCNNFCLRFLQMMNQQPTRTDSFAYLLDGVYFRYVKCGWINKKQPTTINGEWR